MSSRAACIIICLLVAMGLSSCYTTLSLAPLEDYRTYHGYEMDYADSTDENGKTTPAPLSPHIYRCGNDWYVAAVQREFKFPRMRGGLEMRVVGGSYVEETRLEPILTAQNAQPVIRYHKIMPRFAAMLLQPDDKYRIVNISGNVINVEPNQVTRHAVLNRNPEFSNRLIVAAIKDAGGKWLDELPPNAQAIHSPYLESRKQTTYSWKIVESTQSSAPLHCYILSGIALVCVDVPIIVLSTAVFLLAIMPPM